MVWRQPRHGPGRDHLGVTITHHAQHLATRLRPRSRRQLVAAILVAVLVLGAGGWWLLGRADSATTGATTTATVSTGTFQQTVTGSGTIQPSKQAELAFDVSGRVTAVEVEAGDKVAAGDVLATLDTVSLDAALASAKAQREAAATTVANDGSESAVQRAAHEAALASARADVAQAEDDLAAATLTAPFSGTVADVTIAVGDQAGSSAASGSGTQAGAGGSGQGAVSATTTSTSTAAVTLVKPSTFVVETDVAAADVTKVKKGMQAQITPADATEAIFGTVQEVGLVAETSTSGTATFPVTVRITGTQKGLYAGTSAEVSIVVKQVEDVLTVPTQALTTTGGTTYVQKVDGSSTTRTAVTVGETYGMSTEITKGLAAGDTIQVTTPGRTRTSGSSRSGQQEGGFPGGGAPPSGGGMPAGGFPGGAPQ